MNMDPVANTEGEVNNGVTGGANEGIAGDDGVPLIEGSEVAVVGGELAEEAQPNAGDKRTRRQCCGYPLCILFILGNEFCERFSHYGIKGILVIYLTSQIGFNPSAGTGITHGVNMLCMSTPLIGAIIADTCWGRYKTILIISLIYALGNITLAVTAIPALGGTDGNWYGPIAGLLIIGFGTGGIKSSVSAFGADQFDESKKGQEKSIKFFSFFYAAINAGSLISLFVTPFFKGNIRCFGGPCYFLAFGLPAILMIFAVILFVIGGLNGGYVRIPPKGSVIKEACACIRHALSRKRKKNHEEGETRSHWMDWADDKFSPKQISDVKSVLNVFTVFAPLPVFWSLYDQQSTRWVLQSQKMDARIGSWVFQPEQLEVLNPILILLFIPLFDHGFYPLARKCTKDTPLRRMGAGMVFAGISFLASGFLEIAIERSAKIAVPSSNHLFLSVINADSRPIQFIVGDGRENEIPSDAILNMEVVIPMTPTLSIQWRSGIDPLLTPSDGQTIGIFLDGFHPDKSRIIVHFVPEINGGGIGRKVHAFDYFSSLARPLEYKANISVVSTLQETIYLKNVNQLGAKAKQIDPSTSETTLTLAPGKYSMEIQNQKLTMDILNGGVYCIAVFRNNTENVAFDQKTVLDPYSLNVFLQVPQIIIITMGEIMVSITGLSFAYSQSPGTMKSLLQAGWYLTIFFGNLIDVIVIGSQSIKILWVELFFFAGLIFLFLIPFIILAKRYKYVQIEEEAKSD